MVFHSVGNRELSSWSIPYKVFNEEGMMALSYNQKIVMHTAFGIFFMLIAAAISQADRVTKAQGVDLSWQLGFIAGILITLFTYHIFEVLSMGYKKLKGMKYEIRSAHHENPKSRE